MTLQVLTSSPISSTHRRHSWSRGMVGSHLPHTSLKYRRILNAGCILWSFWTASGSTVLRVNS
jgi:hypothetical protein